MDVPGSVLVPKGGYPERAKYTNPRSRDPVCESTGLSWILISAIRNLDIGYWILVSGIWIMHAGSGIWILVLDREL